MTKRPQRPTRPGSNPKPGSSRPSARPEQAQGPVSSKLLRRVLAAREQAVAPPAAARTRAVADRASDSNPGKSNRPASTADPGQAQELEVDAERAGQRLDNFLLGQLKGVPRTLIYRLLRKGAVRVNGKRAKPETRLDGGERVHVPAIRVAAVDQPVLPPNQRLDWLKQRILFEDERLLVLDKPVGLACHGGSGLSFGAIEALRALYPQASLELVHRLDRDTSGLLLIAKKRSMLNALQNLIRAGAIDKRYLALVVGTPDQRQFDVNVPLLKNTLNSGERIVRVDPAGKPALTRFRLLERFAGATLLEAELLTGRTHQIRVHTRHTGHPIVGDRKYGDAEHERALPAQARERMWLHAWKLRFELDGRVVEFQAPEPAELGALRASMRGPATG